MARRKLHTDAGSSKVSFSRTGSPGAVRLLGILLIACTAKPTNEIPPLPYSSLPSMKSPKLKRISYVKAGVLIVDQVKPAILKGTAVRFDLSKGNGIK